MKRALIRIAQFFRLLNSQYNLSLTHAAIWITLIKLAMAPAVTQPLDVVAFIGALASYQAKRKIEGAGGPAS